MVAQLEAKLGVLRREMGSMTPSVYFDSVVFLEPLEVLCCAETNLRR